MADAVGLCACLSLGRLIQDIHLFRAVSQSPSSKAFLTPRSSDATLGPDEGRGGDRAASRSIRSGLGEDPDAASPRRFAWESSQTFLQDSADGTHKDADAAGAVSRAERPPSTRTPRGSRMSPLAPVRESAEKKGSAQSWMDRNAGTGTSVNGNVSGREVGG